MAKQVTKTFLNTACEVEEAEKEFDKIAIFVSRNYGRDSPKL